MSITIKQNGDIVITDIIEASELQKIFQIERILGKPDLLEKAIKNGIEDTINKYTNSLGEVDLRPAIVKPTEYDKKLWTREGNFGEPGSTRVKIIDDARSVYGKRYCKVINELGQIYTVPAENIEILTTSAEIVDQIEQSM